MTTTPPKPRRIRVCECLHCGGLFKWQRRRTTDTADIQICPHCYMAIDGKKIPNTLERPEDYPHIK